MVKLNKRISSIYKKINSTKKYDIIEAIELLKKLAINSFIESIDIAINLNIDARKSTQNIRGFCVLPHGIGRNVRVAVFAQGDNVSLAKKAGGDLVGLDDLANKIKENKLNFDVVIASPDTMHVVGALGQILGPKGLMPNPKVGTLTSNIVETIKNIKKGQIRYRNDKNGIVHTTIGKINFEAYKLKENIQALLVTLKKVKPVHIKGTYIKKISLSTTMGGSVLIDQNSIS